MEIAWGILFMLVPVGGIIYLLHMVLTLEKKLRETEEVINLTVITLWRHFDIEVKDLEKKINADRAEMEELTTTVASFRRESFVPRQKGDFVSNFEFKKED